MRGAATCGDDSAVLPPTSSHSLEAADDKMSYRLTSTQGMADDEDVTSSTSSPEPNPAEVAARLERYDLGRSVGLQGQFPPGQYPHTRRCATLVPLFHSPLDGKIHVMLTRRAHTLRTHAKQVAFPGGMADPQDVDDVATALREAREEVGLAPCDVTVVARLPPSFVRPNNSVFPVVGFIPAHFTPHPNPHEVSLVFSVPLTRFLDDGVAWHTFTFPGASHRYLFPSLNMRPHALPLSDKFESDNPSSLSGAELLSSKPPPPGAEPLPDSLNVFGYTCGLCVLLTRAIYGPFSNVHTLLDHDESSSIHIKNSRLNSVIGAGCTDKMVAQMDLNQQRDELNSSSDVFSDWVKVYHILCKASKEKSRL